MKTLFTLILYFNLTIVFSQSLIKDFTLINVRDNSTVTLSDFKNKNGVVVVFVSNTCPYDGYYKDRLKDLINIYGSRVQFVLINSNIEPEENPEQMSIHFTDIQAPYLIDKEQIAIDLFKARKTPEVFLLKWESNQCKVIYNGAIDDNPQNSEAVKEHFLKDAIEAILNSQKISIVNQRATGCTIRKK